MVIVAAISLMDLRVLVQVWRCAAARWCISLVASAGVILLGVLQGIVVAVALAILLFFRRNWWPHGEVLGMTDDLEGGTAWTSVTLRPPSPRASSSSAGRHRLFFANAGIFRQEIRDLVRDHRPRFVVLQCEAITDVDVTAAEMLRQLDLELNGRRCPPRLRRAPAPPPGSHPALRAPRDARSGPLSTPRLDTAITAVQREAGGRRSCADPISGA